jgi:Arc/MetJ-type ribon-helix-helix transcriptional regulator
MSEPKTPYVINTEEPASNGSAIAITISVTMVEVAMLSDLVARGLAKNKSEAGRDSIRHYYASTFDNANASDADAASR